MNGQTEPTRTGQLVLARLLVAGEKGATVAEIRKALEPLVGHRWNGSALTERLARAVADLEAAGLLVLTRKGKTERGTITAEGRRQATEALGLDQLPPKTTWDKLKKTYVAALALGLPAPKGPQVKSFGGDPGFRAALLRSQLGLPLPDFPKPQDALDALSWTLMGFEPGPKFSVKAVQAALILRELGDSPDPGPRPDPAREVARLLARKVGARQAGKGELREASIRSWIDGEAGVTDREPQSLPIPAPPAPPVALDAETFARRVVEAARSSPSGRFGENKVFVSHVWLALRDDPAFSGMGLDGFKRRLAEANNARLLHLSRADMVEAMDPEDVRLSEVPYLGATFHFVRIG